jgi:hypothetical protein
MKRPSGTANARPSSNQPGAPGSIFYVFRGTYLDGVPFVGGMLSCVRLESVT